MIPDGSDIISNSNSLGEWCACIVAVISGCPGSYPGISTGTSIRSSNIRSQGNSNGGRADIGSCRSEGKSCSQAFSIGAKEGTVKATGGSSPRWRQIIYNCDDLRCSGFIVTIINRSPGASQCVAFRTRTIGSFLTEIGYGYVGITIVCSNNRRQIRKGRYRI